MRAADLQRANALVANIAEAEAQLAKVESATSSGLRIPNGPWINAPASALPAIKAAVRRELELTLAAHRRTAAQIGLVL